eukprot:6184817-Pleurochrysis_carterae.AAC.3
MCMLAITLGVGWPKLAPTRLVLTSCLARGILTTHHPCLCAACSGPFTLFAPTDEAFNKLPDGQLDALLGDTDALTRILQYHVICGQQLASNLLANSWQTTLGGFSLRLEIVKHGNHGHTYVSNGELDEVYDLAAANGIIHTVDEVLTPPTLADVVRFDRSLSTLGNSLTSSVASLLSGERGLELTLFAPNNAAFDALSPEDSARLLGNETGTTLYYHVLRFKSTINCLPSGAVASYIGLDLLVENHDDHKHVNDASFVVEDIMATNGVMHIINVVLKPPTLIDMLANIASNPYYQMYGALSFSRLLEAIQSAGLEDALSSGEYTLFAPSDAAFEKLQSVPSGEDLRDLLLYHVVPNRIINSIAIPHGSLVMGNGETTHFDTSSDEYSHHHLSSPHIHGGYINNVSLYWTDIPAVNGVIHEVTEVLVPK